MLLFNKDKLYTCRYGEVFGEERLFWKLQQSFVTAGSNAVLLCCKGLQDSRLCKGFFFVAVFFCHINIKIKWGNDCKYTVYCYITTYRNGL